MRKQDGLDRPIRHTGHQKRTESAAAANPANGNSTTPLNASLGRADMLRNPTGPAHQVRQRSRSRPPPETAAAGPSRASSSASRSPASRTARATGHPVAPERRRRSLPHGPFPPYPYPSGTRVRRSWAILRPVDCPKCLGTHLERPLKPGIGVRSGARCSLSGPPDTLPIRPSGGVSARTDRCASTRPQLWP